MASVYKEIKLNVSSSAAWDVVRDIGNVHVRLVPGYAEKVRLEGNSRILTMSNGNTVKEIILDVNEAASRIAYTVVDSVMPLEFHHASFQVFPIDNETCKLVWITDLLPNSLVNDVLARVDRGSQVIKQTIEKQYK